MQASGFGAQISNFLSHILPNQSNHSVNARPPLSIPTNHLKTAFKMVRSFNSIAFIHSVSITMGLFLALGGLEWLDRGGNMQMTLDPFFTFPPPYLLSNQTILTSRMTLIATQESKSAKRREHRLARPSSGRGRTCLRSRPYLCKLQ